MGLSNVILSLEKHKELGRKLKELHRYLVRKEVLIMNDSKTKKQGVKKAQHHTRAINSLCSLRSEMEEICFIEHTQETADMDCKGLSIYYRAKTRIEEKE